MRKSIYLILFFLKLSLAKAQTTECPHVNSQFTGWQLSTSMYSPGSSTCDQGSGCNVNAYIGQNTIDNTRFNVITDNTVTDSYINPVLRSGSAGVIKLGNSLRGAQTERLVYDFEVKPDNAYFTYYSAVVLQNPNHIISHQPFFDVKMFDMTNASSPVEILCGRTVYVSGTSSTITGFVSTVTAPNDATSLFYRPWTSNGVDLAQYINKNVRVVFTTGDCSESGHFGYAYIDVSCLKNGIISTKTANCNEYVFTSSRDATFTNETYLWDFGDGTTSTEKSPKHLYTSSGIKNVVLKISGLTGNCSQVELKTTLNLEECNPFNCVDCIPSFSPLPGQKYVLSAWVKEQYNPNAVPVTYLNSGISIGFDHVTTTSSLLMARPSGPVIDGWQRIEYTFTVPANAKSIELALVNESSGTEAYFDDVRVHPFLSNAKSFVYDPSTQRLVAELDENNYATKYEYDDEGILIRVKKETERGVMTIKESRSNQSKLNFTK